MAEDMRVWRPRTDCALAGVESAVLDEIGRAIVADPAAAARRILEEAIRLTNADSAGMSLLSHETEQQAFRWDAIVGAFAEFEGVHLDLLESPSELTRQRGHPLILSRPDRAFGIFEQLQPRVEELLVVPLFDGAVRFVGTLWIATTRDNRHFGAEDVRIGEQLATQLLLARKMSHDEAGARSIQRLLSAAKVERDLPAQSFDEIERSDDPDIFGSAVDELKGDVAHLVEASSFLRSILASSADSIQVLDLDGTIQFVSAAGLDLFGASDLEAMRGRSWQEIWTGAERLDAEQCLRATARGENRRFQGRGVTITGEQKDWSVHLSPLRDRTAAIRHIVAISRDVTSQRRSERQRDLLTNELGHRVKNILAMVGAVARQTLRPPATLSDAADHFIARLAALGEAQDLLTQSAVDSADIGLVIRRAIAPHENAPGDPRFCVEGPPMLLAPSKTLALALAVHELATNAAKYGALSRDTGRVAINWALTSGQPGRFDLNWRESGGPEVITPRHRGFGSRLLERALAAEFGGSVEILFDATGLHCRLSAPAEPLVAGLARPRGRAGDAAGAPGVQSA